jgi:capsular exopolysaccharide synthesis family protein
MSTFFRALERAEQERALRRPATQPESTSAPSVVSAAPVTVPSPVPESVFTAPPPPAIEPSPSAGLADRDSEFDEHLVSLLAPTSFEAEQYRELRHALEQLRRSTELSVIAVSSPVAADGKTTTAINLAGALAQAPDARILLVDADLRAPRVASCLGINEHVPGLVDAILKPGLTLEAVTQKQRHLNLSVITTGRRPSVPYEILKSARVGQLFAETRRRYDYIIVDTPPVVSVPDGRVFGEWVDGFLIVVAAHKTPRKLLEEVFNLMDPSKIVGLVFNGDDHHVSKDSYDRYGSSGKRTSRHGTRRRPPASDE